MIERQIRRGGYDVEVTRVDTAEEMRIQLESCEWDLVISDYYLPESSLDETLAVCRADGRDIPFLLISGSVGDEAAVAAMKAGVDDYLPKESPTRPVPVIQRERETAGLRSAPRTSPPNPGPPPRPPTPASRGARSSRRRPRPRAAVTGGESGPGFPLARE